MPISATPQESMTGIQYGRYPSVGETEIARPTRVIQERQFEQRRRAIEELNRIRAAEWLATQKARQREEFAIQMKEAEQQARGEYELQKEKALHPLYFRYMTYAAAQFKGKQPPSSEGLLLAVKTMVRMRYAGQFRSYDVGFEEALSDWSARQWGQFEAWQEAVGVYPSLETVTFWQRLGRPELSMVYGMPTIPKGQQVTGIKPTEGGGIELVTQPTDKLLPSMWFDKSITESLLGAWSSFSDWMQDIQEAQISRLPFYMRMTIGQRRKAELTFALQTLSVPVGVVASGESFAMAMVDIGNIAGVWKIPHPRAPITLSGGLIGGVGGYVFRGGDVSEFQRLGDVPVGYLVGSALGDYLIGLGIGKGISYAKRGVSYATRGIVARVAESPAVIGMEQKLSHLDYVVHQAWQSRTEWIKQALPTFRGSSLDKFLFEHSAWYQRTTGGMAKEVVSFPSVAYSVPSIRSEIFAYGLTRGVSVLQTFKPEIAVSRKFIPTYYAWGGGFDYLLVPAITDISKYEHVYKPMPKEYMRGFEKPQPKSLSDFLKSTRGEMALSRLISTPITIGHIILPTIEKLPSMSKTLFSPLLLGIGAVSFAHLFGTGPTRIRPSTIYLHKLSPSTIHRITQIPIPKIKPFRFNITTQPQGIKEAPERRTKAKPFVYSYTEPLEKVDLNQPIIPIAGVSPKDVTIQKTGLEQVTEISMPQIPQTFTTTKPRIPDMDERLKRLRYMQPRKKQKGEWWLQDWQKMLFGNQQSKQRRKHK